MQLVLSIFKEEEFTGNINSMCDLHSESSSICEWEEQISQNITKCVTTENAANKPLNRSLHVTLAKIIKQSSCT